MVQWKISKLVKGIALPQSKIVLKFPQTQFKFFSIYLRERERERNMEWEIIMRKTDYKVLLSLQFTDQWTTTQSTIHRQCLITHHLLIIKICKIS